MVQFARIAAAKMKDMQRHLDKLRDDAAECAVIAGEATERAKNELFLRLSQHLSTLADEVEKVLRSTVQPD